MIKPALRCFCPRHIVVPLTLGATLLSMLVTAAVADDASPAITPPPDVLLGPLFNDVQTAKLFNDQKTFADAVPKSDPLMILADYRMQQHQSSFDLRHFVTVNFTLPQDKTAYVPPAGQNLREHINGLWSALTRTTGKVEKWDSLLALPKPYVVPGGRFREVYYWDSYFTMLGLAESGRWDTISDMVENFAWQIDAWGHIPNGNRTYYLSRSQPPFFALMVELLASHDGDAALQKYLPQMKKEHDYWMAGAESLARGGEEKRAVKLPDGAVLNRYWDDRDTPRPESWVEDVSTAKDNPNRRAGDIYRDIRAAAASGWDFSSRWMDDVHRLSTLRTTRIVPVDLNALMFKMEQIIAKASRAAADSATAQRYDELASQRQRAIEKYLWNARQGWYADYDLDRHAVRSQLTAAALFPLYTGAASAQRAAKMAGVTESQLLKSGGIATTLVNSGQQWDLPNGWAPLQWVTVAGLHNYGSDKLAMQVSWRFLRNVQHTYDREHKLVEKYDITSTGTGGGGGEYPLQDGFGWTNGVTLKMLDMVCPQDKPCDSVPAAQPQDAKEAASRTAP